MAADAVTLPPVARHVTARVMPPLRAAAADTMAHMICCAGNK